MIINMKNVLEINGLTKVYNDFTLDHVNLFLPYGKIMGLIGENGAGKTTIIKLILNAIRRDDGKIEIFGKDNIQFESIIKEKLGVGLDQCYFDDCLDIKAISTIMKPIFKNWDNKIYFSYIDRLKLSPSKRIGSYSKGMKAKLNIAITLSTHPKLLILDEPTTGLDPIIRDEILQIYLDYVKKQNASILFSSHITSDIEKIADIVTILHKGKIILTINQKDIKNQFSEVVFNGNEPFDSSKKGVLFYIKSVDSVRALIRKDSYQFDHHKYFPVNIEKVLLYSVNGEKGKGETLL
ncbi:MAG TPA: ABC transporter [Ruminococcaceae bacterium]|nr:ABC transporter [Oscillospiraceae bacterium]